MLTFYLSMLEDEGQKSLFEALYTEKKYRMFAIAMRYLHNPSDAEDAVHEAFLRITGGKTKIFDIEPHKRTAYLDLLIRNVAVDMYKKKKREVPVDFTDDFGEEYTFEDSVVGKIAKDELISFIMSMPAAQRDTVYMKSVLKLSNAEIAEQLGITEEAVRQRMHAARKTIRLFMEKGGK